MYVKCESVSSYCVSAALHALCIFSRTEYSLSINFIISLLSFTFQFLLFKAKENGQLFVHCALSPCFAIWSINICNIPVLIHVSDHFNSGTHNLNKCIANCS